MWQTLLGESAAGKGGSGALLGESSAGKDTKAAFVLPRLGRDSLTPGPRNPGLVEGGGARRRRNDGAGPLRGFARSATRGEVVGRRPRGVAGPGRRGRFEAIASSSSTSWASRERRPASTRRGGRTGAAWPRCRACGRSRRRRPRGGRRPRRPVPGYRSMGSGRLNAGNEQARRSRPTPLRSSSSSSS